MAKKNPPKMLEVGDINSATAGTQFIVTIEELRAIRAEALGNAEMLKLRLAQIEDSLRTMIEVGKGTVVSVDDYPTDGLCGRVHVYAHGDVPAQFTLAVDALGAVSRRIEEQDLALGQIRALATTGEMGTTPLSMQDSRLHNAGVPLSEHPYGCATPDDAVADVAAELFHLARMATTPARPS
jgi:hypothetical protein